MMISEKINKILKISQQRLDKIQELKNKYISQIEALTKELNEVTTKYADRSQIFIDDKIKELETKKNRIQQKMEIKIQEKTEQIENWVAKQKQKIEEELKEKTKEFQEAQQGFMQK